MRDPRLRLLVLCLTALTALAGVVAVSAGAAELPAEDPGTLYAWGLNAEGQLGIPGDPNNYSYPDPAPVDLPAGTKVVDVAGGDGHTLALTTSGAVYAWGDGVDGDLGQGSDTAEQRSPVEVEFPPGTEIASVAAGQYVSFAVTTDGEVYSWGTDYTGQLGDGVVGTEHEVNGVPKVIGSLGGVTQVVTAGYANAGWAMAVTKGGEAYTWGNEVAGQLGNGVEGNAAGGVEPADDDPTPTALPLSGITQVAAGYEDGFALDAAGSVYGWGYDECEQLGNHVGDYCKEGTIQTTPTAVDFPAGVHVTSIGFGGAVSTHGIASDSNGDVYVWGEGNAYTEGKYFTPTLFEVPGGAPAAEVEASGNCNYVLTAGGVLYANGDYVDGYCGFATGGSSLLSPLQAVKVPAGEYVTGFGAGDSDGAAIVTPELGAGPTVTEVSPATGPAAGGNTVTVRGTRFAAGARVFFGTQTADDVAVINSKELTATAPAGTGTVDVMVAVNERNSEHTDADHYTYEGGSGSGSGEGGGSGSGSGAGGGSGSGAGHGGGSGSGASGTARLGGVTLSGDEATISLSCLAGAKSSCAFTLTLTATASGSSRSDRRAEVLGKAKATVPAGHGRKVKLALDAAGKRMLKAKHRLSAELTVLCGGHVVGSRGLRFRGSARHA